MLKVRIEVVKKDFCVQIGYNRRAVKTYGQGMTETVIPEGVSQHDPSNNVVS